MSAQGQVLFCRRRPYIVQSPNAATNAVEADGDAQASNLAIEWAASLLLLAHDDAVLVAFSCRRAPSETYAREISMLRVRAQNSYRDIAGRTMIERIVIEAETPGDSRTMSPAPMDRLVIGENLICS